MVLPTVNMLWIGDALGPVECLSIASWMACGHTVRLHAYDHVANVPANVEMVDAAQTAPFDVVRNLRFRRTGSYAVASDYFRYRLQQDRKGMWSDIDMVCLKPVTLKSDCIFGFEDADTVNSAILYLSGDLPIVSDLVATFNHGFVPPWLKGRLICKYKMLSLLGFPASPGDMPWGTHGPRALTHLAHRHGLIGAAHSPDVFYPLDHRDAHLLFDPAFSLDSIFTENTLTLHLWNEILHRRPDMSAPSGSPLARLYREYGL